MELTIANFLSNLKIMEQKLKILEHEFELFFGGGRKYPPTKEQKELEDAVRYYGKVTLPSTQQQYLFSNFQHKWSLMNSRWNKLMELKLNGISSDPRLTGRAMKDLKTFFDLEKVKEGQQAQNFDSKRQIPEDKKDKTIPKEKKSDISSLFEKFNEAKMALGQTLELDKVAFEKKLEKQKKELLEKHKGKDVVFSVAIENGKAKLKAKVLKE